MTELGYDKYTQTMQDKVWGLWKDYLEDWSATAPGRQFLFVMNQAIEWPGGEVPTHDEAKKMAVAAAEARAASGAAAQQQPKGGFGTICRLVQRYATAIDQPLQCCTS